MTNGHRGYPVALASVYLWCDGFGAKRRLQNRYRVRRIIEHTGLKLSPPFFSLPISLFLSVEMTTTSYRCVSARISRPPSICATRICRRPSLHKQRGSDFRKLRRISNTPIGHHYHRVDESFRMHRIARMNGSLRDTTCNKALPSL